MHKTASRLETYLVNFISALILGFFTYTLTRGGQKIDKNDAAIKELAKIVYVDERDKEIKGELDKKLDKETFALFLKSWESTQTDVREIKNYLLNKK